MGVMDSVVKFIMPLVGPWIFIGMAVSHIPQAFITIVSSGEYSKLFSPSAFLAVMFGKFWATVGPEIKEDFKPRVVPVLEGRVRDGKVVDEQVYEPISGVIMEIGAGSGMWTDVLASFTGAESSGGAAHNLRKRKGDASAPRVTKIYGVEPNQISAASLRKRVDEFGLDGIYEVVPVGIEQVTDPTAWDGEIPEGSLDCIVCICCLCSIPDQEKNIQYLYKLLKPGGRWYIHEHVQATRGGILTRLYQCKFCSQVPQVQLLMIAVRQTTLAFSTAWSWVAASSAALLSRTFSPLGHFPRSTLVSLTASLPTRSSLGSWVL